MKLKYNHYYLVSTAAQAEVRVTQRVEGSPIKPRTVRFFPSAVDERENQVGVLDLTDALWKEWFGTVKKAEFIPGMETAASAAQSMVERGAGITYGCPLCPARFRDLEESQQHVAEEIEKLVAMCEVVE